MSIKIDLVFSNPDSNCSMMIDERLGVRGATRRMHRPIQIKIHKVENQIIDDEFISDCKYACSKDSPYMDELVVII